MQQQNKASAQATSLPAIPAPKEWHASEIAAPDPCNSAIKRISGKQVYLREKPQALILLQAAEIERLTGYLNDYKCKYRALSKEPLDRQSYEIQIKELFERDSVSKIEIERLTKIITTLTISGEQYKKQLLSAQEKYKAVAGERDIIGEKYARLQKQLQNTRENFDRFIKKSEADVHSLNNQLASHKTYTESVLKNNNDLVARVNTIPNYERKIFELETQLAFYLEQSQRLNKDIEAKTEKLINQQRGYSTLFERHKNLQKTHEDLQNELSSHAKDLEQSNIKISQLQGEGEKVKALHEATVRETTEAIIRSNFDLDALRKQVKDYSQRWSNDQKTIQILRKNSAVLDQKYAQSLQQSVNLSNNSQRLQETITSLQQLQAKKQQEWQSEKTSLEGGFQLKFKQLQDKNEQQIAKYAEILSKKQKEIDELGKSYHDLQKALHAAKGQLKISQQIIKTQQAENERLKKFEEELKQVVAERNSLTKVVKQKSSSISQLEKTLKQEREKQAELAAKSSKLQEDHEDLKKKFAQENISLNKMINNKVTESESLKRQLINNQNDLRAQFESDFEALNKAHLEKIAKIHKEKQEIIDAHSDLKSQNDGLKAKHSQIQQEKLNIQKKHAQLSAEYQTSKAKIVQLEKSIKQYAQKITELTKAQQLLKKYFEQTSENNEKLLSQLKKKQADLQKSQIEWNKQKQELNQLRATSIKSKAERICFEMEIYELKQETKKLKQEISKIQQQIAQKESQIAKIKQERGQLSQMLQGKTKENEGLKRKMIELQEQLRESFEQALKEKEDEHTKAYQVLSEEKQGLSKKIKEIEPHVAIASDLHKQKQALQLSFKILTANHNVEKTRSSNLIQQNEQLRKAIIDTETRLKSYYQDELALKGKLSQQEIDRLAKQKQQLSKEKQQLKAQRDSMFTMSTEYQARITLLIQEIDRLHTILNNNIAQNKTDLELVRTTNAALQGQVTSLTEQLQDARKREEQLITKYTIITKRITSYQETLENIRSELVNIQLRTAELRQERDLLIKKNMLLVKSIRALSNELDSLQQEGDSIAAFFTKESSIHKELTSRFTTLQDLLNSLQSQKLVVEEKTVEITQVASK